MNLEKIYQKYGDIENRLNQVEEELNGYQSFYTELADTFVDQGPACYERRGSGRKIKSDFIEKTIKEELGQDKHLEKLFSKESAGVRDLRSIFKYCRDEIGSLKEEQTYLKSRRKDLETEIGFHRHPKKDYKIDKSAEKYPETKQSPQSP